MDSTFKTFLIIAVVLLLGYTAFELYNSITGTKTEFNDTVVEIRTNLGDDVLNHINNTSSLMVYYPSSDNNIEDESQTN
jgi:hypothetical protein